MLSGFSLEKWKCKYGLKEEEPYGTGLELGITIWSHDLKQNQTS